MTKVFINQGHSLISDPGAVNKNLNLKEAVLVNAMGIHLADILRSMGIDVVLYQEKKSLNEVPVEANKSNADLFVSLHMNASGSGTAKGVEVLYCEGSTNGLNVARNILGAIIKVGDYTFSNRGVKSDASRHLCVLRKTKMTSCLVEMGFIDNDKEALFVKNHLKECAENIAKGIKLYLESQNLWKPQIIENKKVDIIIKATGNNDTYDLFIEDKVILKGNKLDTIHTYLLEKHRDMLY